MLFCSAVGSAQIQDFVDESRFELNKKPRFLLGFDNRYSIVSDEPVRIGGIRFGWDYKKIKLYHGMYFLREDIIHVRGGELSTNPGDTGRNLTNFFYFSTTIDYVFHNTKKWEFSVPVQLGIGTGSKKHMRGDSLISEDSPQFIPFEFSVNGLYKLNSWAGISAGVGYRISLYNTNEFDGSFYSFGLKVFLGKLYRTIAGKEEEL
jgi:hypothetical protein